MRKKCFEAIESMTYNHEAEFQPSLHFSEARMVSFISESFEIASRMHVLIQNKIPKGARKK